MGMFDDLICRYPLPVPLDPKELKGFDFNKDLSYQTKDLDNTLITYEIRKDKTLWWDNQEFNDGKRSEPLWVQENIVSGDVHFYHYHRNDEMKNDYYIEYVAFFKNGILESIDLFKFEHECNLKRKIFNQKWFREENEKIILWNKWYMRYGYVFYDKFVALLFRGWRFLLGNAPASYAVERWLRRF